MAPLPRNWEGRVNNLYTRLSTLDRQINRAVQAELEWRDRNIATAKEQVERDKVKTRRLQLSVKVTAVCTLLETLEAEYKKAGRPKLRSDLSSKWNGMEPLAEKLKSTVAPLKNGNHREG